MAVWFLVLLNNNVKTYTTHLFVINCWHSHIVYRKHPTILSLLSLSVFQNSPIDLACVCVTVMCMFVCCWCYCKACPRNVEDGTLNQKVSLSLLLPWSLYFSMSAFKCGCDQAVIFTLPFKAMT